MTMAAARLPRPPGSPGWLASAIAAVREVLREMDYGQRRALAWRTSCDAELPDRAPGSYPEFLLRTRVPGPREPSARQRADGRLVR